jgi:hypothetical protein
VQVDPIKPKLKASGFKLLKLKYDKPLSNFAFKFNLRHSTKAQENAELQVPDTAEFDANAENKAEDTAVDGNGGAHGRAVQVDPLTPALKAPGTKGLKLIYAGPVSNSAFKLNSPLQHGSVVNAPRGLFGSKVGRCRLTLSQTLVESAWNRALETKT